MAAAGAQVLIAASVLVLAGCGSGATARSEDATADTARLELVITRGGREGRLALRGIYDYRRRQGSLTTTLEGKAGATADTPTEVRFFGDRQYSEFESDGTTYWVAGSEGIGIGYPAAAIVPFPEGDADPKESLDRILAAGEEVELGRDEVRGAETTHYRVQVEPKRLSTKVGRPLDLAGGPFSVDVWADDAERVRRLRVVEDEAAATLTYEFFDFGVDVDVERPSADQIVTPEELDRISEKRCKPPRACREAGKGK